MARIEGVDPTAAEPSIKAVLRGAGAHSGAGRSSIISAPRGRRPTIFRGARAMWTGIGGSGLIDEQVQALINRRVAAHNRCEF